MPRRVEPAEYLACVPEPWRGRALAAGPPEPTWRPWRGLRVHVATLRRPEAPARLLVLHGAGGHSGALWPLAGLAASAGYEVLAPDLPGYGLTDVPDPGAVTYPDWVDCAADLLRSQVEADARPILLLGASMGGLLGYSACARVPGAVAHLLATCLLDPSDPICWPALSRWGGALGVRALRPLLAPLARGRAPRLAHRQVPIR